MTKPVQIQIQCPQEAQLQQSSRPTNIVQIASLMILLEYPAFPALECDFIKKSAGGIKSYCPLAISSLCNALSACSSFGIARILITGSLFNSIC